MELWRKEQMGPTVETLLSKNAQKHAKRVRNDWSEDNNNQAEMESLMMENDIASIASIQNDKVAEGMSPQQ